MSEATLLYLRRELVARYGEIKRQLTLRLGSDDLAGEILQETYLHLDRPANVGAVRSPMQYLLTVAMNMARMRFRREKRFVNLETVDAAVGLVDDTSSPAEAAEARLELEALQRAFDELTPRRRRILIAARVDGRYLRDIAAELGVSQRLVELELKQALDHCALRLDRELMQRFGPRPRQTSKTETSENTSG
jgi:RNA polymerase sigma factor (sigma-70 family)